MSQNKAFHYEYVKIIVAQINQNLMNTSPAPPDEMKVKAMGMLLLSGNQAKTKSHIKKKNAIMSRPCGKSNAVASVFGSTSA